MPDRSKDMIKAVIFDMFETLISHYRCPLYFSEQMAEDSGIPYDDFLKLWRETDILRTTGKITFEEIIERILRENGAYSRKVFDNIVRKRTETKYRCFENMHEEIIPMLEGLKKRGYKIGLISNCFSEEAAVIRSSVLATFFDGIFLSWEQGCAKPDEEIFRRCMSYLGVSPHECLYVGDGGSCELEAAEKLGMTAVQAVWYLIGGNPWQQDINEKYRQVYSPLDIISIVDNSNAGECNGKIYK